MVGVSLRKLRLHDDFSSNLIKFNLKLVTLGSRSFRAFTNLERCSSSFCTCLPLFSLGVDLNSRIFNLDRFLLGISPFPLLPVNSIGDWPPLLRLIDQWLIVDGGPAAVLYKPSY